MPIPDLESIMLPMLKFLGDQKNHTMKDVEQNLSSFFALTADEIKQQKPSGGESLFHNRLHWSKFYLGKAQLINGKPRKSFRITERGLGVLKKNPAKIDTNYLMKFDEFSVFIKTKREKD